MHQIWSQLPNFMQVKAFVHAKPFYVMTFFYILSLKLFQYLWFRVGVWVCMSSFMSVRKKQRCLFLQVASAVHKETSELSWVDIISSHVLSLPRHPPPTPPPAEMSGEMKAADRQRSSSDDVQHSRRTSCGEKLDVNADFFSAPRSALFRGLVSGHLKAAPSHHHPLHDITQRYVRLGLPIWAPNMHTLTETDSECATFCSEVICFLTEEREAIVKERLPKGLVR